MQRMIALGLLILLATTVASRAQNGPVFIANNQDAFNKFLDYELSILPTEWSTDLKDAILLAYPSINKNELNALQLRTEDNICSIVPHIDVDKREITIGRGFLLLSAVTSQPLFFGILGSKNYQNAGPLMNYYISYVPSRMKKLFVTCATKNANKEDLFSLDSAAKFFDIPESELIALEQSAAKNMAEVDLGNAVGGIPIYFAIFHEAAFCLLKAGQGQDKTGIRETDADKFALRIIRANRYPTFFAIPPLSVLAFSGYDDFSGLQDQTESIKCRIKYLLSQMNEIDEEFSQIAQGNKYFARNADEMRKGLLLNISAACP